MSELRGEHRILHEELNSSDPETKKDALKKVIVYMSVGKDVSPIFQSVIKCIELPDIEIKKLIYLYIINYSRSRPDDAIMIINQFCRDTSKTSTPLIRALAFRTMGCLRVKQLNEYLIAPLLEGINDSNSYVKKTAIMCVPKVYEISPELVERENIIEKLQDIFANDTNHMVVANCIQALTDISVLKGESVLEVGGENLDRVLLCLNETFEWGQVFILDILAAYKAQTKEEAEKIIDKVMPRLSHINNSIVFSALKVICTFLSHIDEELREALILKLRPPIKSLLNTKPEIVYSVLKFLINVIKLYPSIAGDDFSPFICNYNDEFYIKIEKMDIMQAMATKKNTKKILNEFYEYHKELNSDFVKIALQYIYKIALKVKSEAPHAISIYKKILEGLNKGSQYYNDIANGAAIIIRALPKVKGGTDLVKELSKNYKDLREQESIVGFLWLLGEYCEKVEGSGPILEHFSENFFTHTSAVQLQTLNSGIKMYLNEIEPIDEVLQVLLQKISDKSTSPDLRDRGYIYWRLLYQSPEKASEVIFEEIPAINIEEEEEDQEEIQALIRKGGTVSGHLGRDLNEIFTKKIQVINRGKVEVDNEEIFVGQIPSNEQTAETKEQAPVESQGEIDLLGGGDDLLSDAIGNERTPSPDLFADEEANNGTMEEEDLFAEEGNDDPLDESKIAFVNMAEETLLNQTALGKSKKSGVFVKGYFGKINESIDTLFLNLTVVNNTGSDMSNFSFQIKGNFFGLKVEKPNSLTLATGNEQKLRLEVKKQVNRKQQDRPGHPYTLYTAFKSTWDTYFFKVPVHLHLLLSQQGQLSLDDFELTWNQFGNSSQSSYQLNPILPCFKDTDYLSKLLKANNIFVVNDDSFDDDIKLDISMKTCTDEFCLLKVNGDLASGSYELMIRTQNQLLNDMVYQSLVFIASQ